MLGPEMKSTGEVMGLDLDFRKAYLKSQIAAGLSMPTSGKIFVSVRNSDKRAVAPLARRLTDLGFALVATPGTARVLERYGSGGGDASTRSAKVTRLERDRPDEAARRSLW